MMFDFIALTEVCCFRCKDLLKDGRYYPKDHLGHIYCDRLCYLLGGGRALESNFVLLSIDEYGEPSVSFPDDPSYKRIGEGLFKARIDDIEE